MSRRSAEKLLQGMMTQYTKHWPSSVYPDMKKLREVLTQLSDQQKLHILQQKYSGWIPLRHAAYRDHTEIISTLLTSLQSSADRLKLLMVYKGTPLHVAVRFGRTESAKMMLDCLTADQQIQLMSVQNRWDRTAIQMAENEGHTDTARVLTKYRQSALIEYQQRAERSKKQQQQSRLQKSVSGRFP